MLSTTKVTPKMQEAVMKLAQELLVAHWIYADVYPDGPTDFCIDMETRTSCRKITDVQLLGS